MSNGEKIAGLVGVAALTWYAYNEGKKKHIPAKIPFDIQAAGGTLSNQLANLAILQRIAGEMYYDMSGANIFANHNTDPYEEALALSNSDFVEIYNIYNAKYQSIGGETLTQWIAGEDALMFSAWQSIQIAMLNRLNSLNLP